MGYKKKSSNIPTVLIAGIDTIKKKNLYQLIGLRDYGYRFIIITTDSMGNSTQVVGSAENIKLYICNTRVRTRMIISLIRILCTTRICLAEIYPQSFLSLIMTILLKLTRIPVLIIARGQNEYFYVTNKMPKMKRIAIRCVYFLADAIIYKELYMHKMLLDMRKKKIWMLPNAVKIPTRVNKHSQDKCHFLFLNTLKSFRHPDIALKAFLEICNELNLNSQSHIRFLLIGFFGEKASVDIRRNEANLRMLIAGKDIPVELHPWTNEPEEWFDNADIFLLPADVVFLNYSLLEAMARGVPPIVQETLGSELIVTHKIDGYILPLDVEIWKEHMIKLIRDTSLLRRLGLAARQKVTTYYSLETYLRRYSEIYGKIRKQG